MPKTVNAITRRLLGTIKAELGARQAALADALLQDALPEDLVAMPEDVLSALVVQTDAALVNASGQDHISVIEPLRHQNGQSYTLVSIINKDKPFLFDSVLGEINASMRDILLATHPVLDVMHDADGYKLVDKSRPGLAREDTVRTSCIQVVLAGADEEAIMTLRGGIEKTISLVNVATGDWQAMLQRLDRAIAEYTDGVLPAKKSDIEEAIAFIEWLRDDNFTLLGMREYDYTGGEKRGKLERSDKPSLGILRDPEIRVLVRGDQPVITTPEIRAFLNSRDLLIVTKANSKSVVHRRAYLDYIGIKTYDAKGKLAGELRVVGLFTSTAYNRSVMRVPYIRSKADAVMKRLQFEPLSHSGKALANVLESYPREELFQIDVSQLTRNAEAIIALNDRPKVRVLSRIDAFDRFVSVLVFVPKDRYDSTVREAIGDMLAQTYDGHVSAFYPTFLEGTLTRVHFIIGRRSGKTPTPTQASLEHHVAQIIRTWDDEFADSIAQLAPQQRQEAMCFSFPHAYRDSASSQRALEDFSFMQAIGDDQTIAVDFFREPGAPQHQASLRIYHADAPVALSRRVPVLENMGFRVISESTYCITDRRQAEPREIWLHDMELESRSGAAVDLDSDKGAIFETAFLSVWHNQADNDPFNVLILAAGLSCRKTIVLRAIGRYLKQGTVAFSQAYMAATLAKYPDISKQLFKLFETRFAPLTGDETDDSRAVDAKHIRAGIADMLAEIDNIDEDLIVRHYLSVLDAMLRTNYYRNEADGELRRILAFKLDPSKIDFLPQPRPYREIFVYGTEVEGVHLRFGPVARGGLRWSDRAEDYRTEVLGLVKAQQVKNAVIVPVGAKGGFYPKALPADGDRDEIYEAGRAAYIQFITQLLSVTDNLVDDKIVPPADVRRLDRDDPYLVVAADKGTARFSDTANGISQDHDFWLDDAFASGGSAGYDHKAMGITARGGWEAVKRHFREMDKNIQEEQFTVAGVGDMSGDVFGNGMLLSKQIKLIAAFDHRDIFIDPDPDPAISFADRQRLFEMSRSSWQDYDPKKLSKGGGVFSRKQKTITLSKAAAEAIGLTKLKASPNEIMKAILMAEVELMWFGGIGTYVRASHESDADAGDRANDAIRITGKQMRAKVVGEGANLGLTQFGRIEYARHGGRLNSDAIDNSAGVNSSDVEVNIKIALAKSMRDGSLSRDNRDKLLVAMTDSVAELVLRNNYEQTLTLSRIERSGSQNLALQAQLMKSLESRGLLNRAVEMLPDDEAIAELEADGAALTRSEAGVLLSYAKLVLFDDLVASDLPDDPYLEGELINYFPPRMHKPYADNIRTHRLRREIIATVLANNAVNRGGPSIVSRFEDATGALPADIVRAHIVTRDAFGLEMLHQAIDALDNKISGDAQLQLYDELAAGHRLAIGRYLKSGLKGQAMADAVGDLSTAYDALKPHLSKYLPDYLSGWMAERTSRFADAGLSTTHAKTLASLPLLATTPEIMKIARKTGTPVNDAAIAYYAVTKAFRLGRLEHLAHQLNIKDYFDGLAQARALDTIDEARIKITSAALAKGGLELDDVNAAVEQWQAKNAQRIAAVKARIDSVTDSTELTVSRLTVAAGLLSDLAQ